MTAVDSPLSPEQSYVIAIKVAQVLNIEYRVALAEAKAEIKRLRLESA